MEVFSMCLNWLKWEPNGQCHFKVAISDESKIDKNGMVSVGGAEKIDYEFIELWSMIY